MNRETILEAAAQIFSQKGYHATSMQNIAQAVNLRKASLYHHVSSKEEILLELLDQGLDLLSERLKYVSTAAGPPEARLRQAMAVYLQTMADHRDLAAVLLLEHRSLSANARAQHILKRDRFERLWRDLIQEGLDQGVYAPVDPSLAAKGLLGVMNWTITWYRPDRSLTALEIAEYFADLFLHGMLASQKDLIPSPDRSR